jgi:hypothetical protein
MSGFHHRELLKELVEELYGGRTMAETGHEAGPAQQDTAALMSTGLKADRGGEANHLFEDFALIRGDLGAREPRINEEGQVLVILVLELLHHRLAEASGGAPVDPARGISGPVFTEAVIVLLPHGAIGSATAASFGGFPKQLIPAPGDPADAWVNNQLVVGRSAHTTFEKAEG